MARPASGARQIDAHRETWESKPALRALYSDYYRRLLRHHRPGRILEIGGGSGHLRAHLTDVVLTDIQPAPWVDAAADAQSLPFADASFETIVMVDVLHHIEFPARFFQEAARVLKPGGRLLMLDPAITPISHLVLHLTHPEPVDMGADPLASGTPDPARDPFDANQAVPTILFSRAAGRRRFAATHPGLIIRHVSRLSLFAYPLSGGFRSWSLIPPFLVPAALALEAALLPLLGWLMAFRLLVVIEKR